MNIDVLDGSNYFKGLLLLVRKDFSIDGKEAALMKSIGHSLGLEPRFCEEAVRDILDNRYIDDAPPKFSTDELARKFLRDGLRLATVDGEVHPLEEEWLIAVALINGVGPDWLAAEKREAIGGTLGDRFDVFDLRVKYQG